MKGIIRIFSLVLIPALFASCSFFDLNSERKGHDRFGFNVEGGNSYHEASYAYIFTYITYVYGGLNSTQDSLYVAADVTTLGTPQEYSIKSAVFTIPVSSIVVGKDVAVRNPENMILNVVYNRNKIALQAQSGSMLFEHYEMLKENVGEAGQNIRARATFDLSFVLDISGEEHRVLHLTKGVFDIENPSPMSEFYDQR